MRATGGCKGRVRDADGTFDRPMAMPKEVGGTGQGAVREVVSLRRDLQGRAGFFPAGAVRRTDQATATMPGRVVGATIELR